MKLKHITAIVMIVFAAVVIYFLVIGDLLYNPHAKPSKPALHAKIQAIKDGVFSSKPAIVH